MKFGNPEDIIQMTPDWTGERFEDGRPKVPDDIIRRMEKVTTEEAWAVLWNRGYKYNFEGGWVQLNPGRILVGRAVTATFVPRRPDLHEALMKHGHEKEGRIGEMNSWVIETLREDDCIVINLFGKVWEGTFSGGNLATAIATRTKRGQVIHGGIRDAQQMLKIKNLVTFCRGMDPTPIRDTTMIGMNTPCQIGGAICMPGDVVLGTYSGITFIPPHLAQEVVEDSERTRLRDIFGLQRLTEKKYTSHQMDSKWTPDVDEDFAEWRKTHKLEDLEKIDWSKETDLERRNRSEETRL
ncbi:MAG: hypothetical protein R3F07_17720 [Opitutaceae bacterium]